MEECKWWVENMGKTPDEAIMEAEMVIIFIDRKANTYGPIMAFNRKLPKIEIEELAKRATTTGQGNYDVRR